MIFTQLFDEIIDAVCRVGQLDDVMTSLDDLAAAAEVFHSMQECRDLTFLRFTLDQYDLTYEQLVLRDLQHILDIFQLGKLKLDLIDDSFISVCRDRDS